MKKRTRRVLHADKDFNSTRNIPAQARAALNESSGRLPTTNTKRVAVPRSISSSPTRAVVERLPQPESPSKLNPFLDLVIPRPDSPTGSVHADADEDMKNVLMELTDMIQSCPLPPVQKVRSSSSDKALVGKQPSRGRQRLLPPVASSANLEASRNLSGGTLLRGKTHEDLLEDSAVAEYRGPIVKVKPTVPRSIISDYEDKRQQSRSGPRSIEGRRTGSSGRLPQVTAKPVKTPNRVRDSVRESVLI